MSTTSPSGSNADRQLAVVLGASGGTGSALVAELTDRGYQVRAVSRSGKTPISDRPEVESIAADVTDSNRVQTVATGAALVFHAAQPAYHRWAQEFPAMNDAIIKGSAAAGARLIVADNLYMYGPHDGPIVEDLPYAATGKKGRVRAEMARVLLSAHAQGTLPVLLARSSNYFGPHGVNTTAGERVFDVALAGKKVALLGRLDQLHTWSYLPDMARAMVTLAEHDAAYGRAWHLPNNPAVTGRDFLEAVFTSAGTVPRMGTVPRPLIYGLGLINPMMRELPETLFEFERPYLVDDGAYQAAFGPFHCTPFEKAIATTTAWYRTRTRHQTSAAA